MGIFSKFRQFQDKRSDSKVLKAGKIAKNPKAIREDRWAALEYLKELEDPVQAVPALLQRFEFSLEHGINDTREKELAMEAVTHHGEKAIPMVKEHLQQTTKIAWPIKILKSLGKDELVVDALKSVLNFQDVAFDQAQTDKNYDVLCYLIDYKIPGFASTIGHFLKDPDERVRFACAELLIEQDDPEVPGLLEHFLADASAENIRIRQSVLTAFANKKWQIKNPSVFPEGRVMDNLFVNKQGLLETRRG